MDSQNLIEFIHQLELSQWAPVGIVVLMVLESMPFSGLFLPGILIMVGLGSFSSTSYLGFPECVLFASLGALVGDSLGYWMAYLGLNQRLMVSNSDTQKRILDLIRRYGALAVFGGRFLWFVHPLVPVVAGLSRIKPFWFYLADIPAVILWVLLYAGLGHWATGMARERTFEFITVVSVVLIFIAVVALFRTLRSHK